MKYIKKFESDNYEPKDNIQGLKEVFNLVLPNPEVFKNTIFSLWFKN